MSAPTITDKFQAIFTGYTDGFVKHTPPFARRESDNKLVSTKFCGIAKYKHDDPNNPEPPDGFEVDDMVPLTRAEYKLHLEGKQGLAISPLFDMPASGHKPMQKDVCFFSIIDIDVYGQVYTELVRRLYKVGYKFAAFVSKSGGLHLYFFYRSPESAKAVREQMKRIIEAFGMNKAYNRKVEVFPQHDTRKPGQWDKAVFLPFYGSGLEGGSDQLMILDGGDLCAVTKAVGHIESMITTLDDVKKTTDALPYSDAPFCIQMLLLQGGPQNNFNDFLFTAAIYAKTKHGTAFEKAHIEQMNDMCDDPIEQAKVDGIFSSVSKTDYQLAGRCSKEPVCDFCDRAACKLRQFGVGREKKNTVSTVEFGKIFRMLAETPYYLWEARLAGTEEYKMLRIDGAENLLNQRVVQKACIDALGQVPPTVVPKIWEETLNGCLLSIEDVPVAKATDTTELSDLRRLFKRYLTHGQAQNSRPQTVFVKQVYYEDGFYYFQTDGFQEYLRVSKYILGRTNLREQLVEYGCLEGELRYTTGRGEEKVITCWKKEDDAELQSLGTFYEDVMESDADVIAKHPLNKEDKTVSGADEDVRF